MYVVLCKLWYTRTHTHVKAISSSYSMTFASCAWNYEEGSWGSIMRYVCALQLYFMIRAGVPDTRSVLGGISTRPAVFNGWKLENNSVVCSKSQFQGWNGDVPAHATKTNCAKRFFFKRDLFGTIFHGLSRYITHPFVFCPNYAKTHHPNLTAEQRHVYDTLLLNSVTAKQGRPFMIIAPAGTGKPYTEKCIEARLRGQARLLNCSLNGPLPPCSSLAVETPHGRYNAPSCVCKKTSRLNTTCELLKIRMCDIPIWDEQAMTHIDIVSRL